MEGARWHCHGGSLLPEPRLTPCLSCSPLLPRAAMCHLQQPPRYVQEPPCPHGLGAPLQRCG